MLRIFLKHANIKLYFVIGEDSAVNNDLNCVISHKAFLSEVDEAS